VGSPSATDSPAISFASGQRIEEYAEVVALVASGIDPQQFLELARRGRFSYDFLASKPASASLEGYLLPGTYRVLPGQTTAETLMRQLLTRFGESFPPALRAQAKQTAGLDVHQAVILASIVERAAPPAERQPLAADYVDRLRRGECLCADVTLRYALRKPGDWWPALPAPAQSVLRESPYNSHVHHTLPPGPICNPSADTLRAVAAPVRAGP